MRDNMVKLSNTGFSLKLSDSKEVNVVDFKNKQYVTFHHFTKWDDKTYHTYINIGANEWCALMFAMPAIDSMLNKQSYDVPDTILPEKAAKLREPRTNCSMCKDEMTAVILKDGRMKETNLTSQAYKSIKDSNKSAFNQMDYSCDYCGGCRYYGADCHCHKFDCKDCEPDNFCKKCDGILFYSSMFSDIKG